MGTRTLFPRESAERFLGPPPADLAGATGETNHSRNRSLNIAIGLVLLLAAACQRNDDILTEVNRIPAIDDHAHPVRWTTKDEPVDREFDALPVDNMEPSSDPLQLRPTAPGVLGASKTLWNYP